MSSANSRLKKDRLSETVNNDQYLLPNATNVNRNVTLALTSDKICEKGLNTMH